MRFGASEAIGRSSRHCRMVELELHKRHKSMVLCCSDILVSSLNHHSLFSTFLNANNSHRPQGRAGEARVAPRGP
jgi:hypothetical protein